MLWKKRKEEKKKLFDIEIKSNNFRSQRQNKCGVEGPAGEIKRRYIIISENFLHHLNDRWDS